MPDGFRGALEMLFAREQVRLIRAADEAFYAADEARCCDAIQRLYQLFDDELKSEDLVLAKRSM